MSQTSPGHQAFATARLGGIEIRIRSAQITPKEADERLANLLEQLLNYRRQDAAAGMYLTNASSPAVPATPSDR